MNHPLVSVVVPTHNRAAFIGVAIRSVLAQTDKNLEIIVVDDASTDETPVILRQLANIDSRIKILRNTKSLGGGGARNVGIHASSGEWIAFLDDDDEWDKTKIKYQLEKMRAHPSAVACTCSYKLQLGLRSAKVVRIKNEISLDQLLRRNYLGGASMCLCSRNVLLRIGGFDTGFRSGQDWDLWVRLLEEGEIVNCEDVLVNYGIHNGARISNNLDSQYFGARRFYFKYRSLMNDSIRKLRVSNCCFIMSQQKKRGINSRLKYLRLAFCNSSFRVRLSYAKNSLPILIKDFIGEFRAASNEGAK